MNTEPAYFIGTTKTLMGGEAHTHSALFGAGHGGGTHVSIGMASRISTVLFRDGNEEEVNFKDADAVLVRSEEFRP